MHKNHILARFENLNNPASVFTYEDNQCSLCQTFLTIPNGLCSACSGINTQKIKRQEHKTRYIIFLRGLPGAGKTTRALELKSLHHIMHGKQSSCEVIGRDQFYDQFGLEKSKEAYKKFHQCAKTWMEYKWETLTHLGCRTFIIDNTLLQSAIEEHCLDINSLNVPWMIEYVESHLSNEELASRSLSDVTSQQISSMRKTLEFTLAHKEKTITQKPNIGEGEHCSKRYFIQNAQYLYCGSRTDEKQKEGLVKRFIDPLS